jgi:hypothetical protein
MKNCEFSPQGQKTTPLARLLSTSLVFSCLAFAPLANSQEQIIDCSGIADPMQMAQCQCLKGQQNTRFGTTQILAQQSQNDDYLKDVKNKVAGDSNSLATASGGAVSAQVAQSCYSVTKGVFDNVFSSVGSVFGFDLGSLFGSAFNSIGGNLCGELNRAITSRVSFSCPRVSIPGFPINCNGSVGINSNGVQVSGGTTVGGWNAGGTTYTGVNGTTNASGSVNMGPGNRSSGSTTIPASTSTGVLSSISNNVSCWLSGGC